MILMEFVISGRLGVLRASSHGEFHQSRIRCASATCRLLAHAPQLRAECGERECNQHLAPNSALRAEQRLDALVEVNAARQQLGTDRVVSSAGRARANALNAAAATVSQ